MQIRYTLMDGLYEGVRLALVLGVSGCSTGAGARPVAKLERGGGVTWVLAGCEEKDDEKEIEVGVDVLLTVWV